MLPPLKLFTEIDILRRVNRLLLTRFLEDARDSLPAEAVALLATPPSDFEKFCAAWAARFASPGALPEPALRALHAIELLSLPENQAQLAAALSALPPGYIDPNASPLNQALHLWIIANAKPGAVNFPFPPDPEPQSVPPADPPETHTHPSALADSGAQTSTNSSIQEANTPSLHHSTDAWPQPTSNPPIQDEFARLARLSPVEYDLARRGEAKRLSLRLATLDQAVDRARVLEDDAEANAVLFPQLQSWPEPILDAPALFDEVHDRYLLYLHLPAGAAVALALWTPHAHAVPAFAQTPRLNFTSIEPGCGKSMALDLLAAMTPRVLRTDNLKPAVLFRVVHLQQPTLLLDELDTYLHLYPELRGLLNAGHSPGACVYRCEGGIVRSFKAFAATALAGIGHLAPTLRDRSIIIPLVKAPPGVLQARFDKRQVKTENTLGRKIARWVKDNFDAIAACDPVLPVAAYNRLADNWRPLFAIAQIIGGHWPQRTLDAFHSLSSSSPQLSTTAPGAASAGVPAGRPRNTAHHLSTFNPQLLLADIRQLFTQAGAARLTSTQLVVALRALPARPWSQIQRGRKPITESWLGRRLSSLGIPPRNVRLNGAQTKAYDLADLSSALPPS